ncbi:MAG: DUF4129 domain-containing protein, partial [Candidatus Latescibacteria bacterium]|nr:DUF4129 domain-containing protein [Candidatus Latescibacterota bacterium]
RSTLLALGAAALFVAVVEPDPVAAGVFAVLLVLPRTFPLFRFFRLIDPTVAAGLLGGGVLFLPILRLLLGLVDGGGGVPWHAGLPWSVMLFAVWRYQHDRLTGRDHLVLLACGLFLVVAAGEGTGQDWRRPLLFLWVLATAAALARVHLSREENRVLDLARVSAWERGDPGEIGGRIPPFPFELKRSVLRIGLWLVCIGLLLTWALPRLREALRGAFEGVAAAEFGTAKEGGEEKGPPEFEIPPGVVGLPPFGQRLERREYELRRASGAIAFLERGGAGRPLVRGECYDYLDQKGRWVRSRSASHLVYDAQDGRTDGFVSNPFASGEGGETIDYLLPPGPDRTVYSRPEPLGIRAPVLSADGTETLRVQRRGESSLDYRVRVRSAGLPANVRLKDPGPEFALLPFGAPARRIEELAREIVGEVADPVARIRAIRRHLRKNFVNLDEPPADEGEDGGEPDPGARDEETGSRGVDVEEFLFVRRWGDELDFASAGCALLRALGIPCRLATGYREGRWIFDGGFRIYHGFASWAWLEVPFEGVGWYPVDLAPGPPSELDAEDLAEIRELPPEERAEEAEKRVEEARKPPPSRNLFERLEDFLAGAVGSRIGGRILAWALVLGAGALILLLFGFAGDRGRRVLFARGEGPARLRLAPFYERLLAVLARHGLRRRRTQTPLEFAGAAVRYFGPEVEDVRRLTNAFCAHRYGGAPLTGAREKVLMERVARLDEALEKRRPSRRRSPPRTVLALLGLALTVGLAVARPTGPREAVHRLGSEIGAIRERAAKEIARMG